MNEQTWEYESTHGPECATCASAADSARAYARVTGSIASTYTVSYREEDHSGTATRVNLNKMEG
jgi:hypothetical protein